MSRSLLIVLLAFLATEQSVAKEALPSIFVLPATDITSSKLKTLTSHISTVFDLLSDGEGRGLQNRTAKNGALNLACQMGAGCASSQGLNAFDQN